MLKSFTAMHILQYCNLFLGKSVPVLQRIPVLRGSNDLQPVPLPRLVVERKTTDQFFPVRRTWNSSVPSKVQRDTVISWESLDFQPEFTATASTIGFGLWSHDIGGHFFGSKNNEPYTRWIQSGIWSPILRLHSSLNPFLTKEPWVFQGRSASIGY
jgi:hypothetical protein